MRKNDPMKVAGPKKVLNFRGYIPAGGEDFVNINYCGCDLTVEILCESEGEEGDEAVLTLKFVDARYFIKSSLPGIALLSASVDSDVSVLSHLVEYEWSEWVALDEQATGLSGYKHFRMFLHSVGLVLDVVANGVCQLSER